MSLLTELKRRNVFRVGIAYALIAWVALQAAEFGLELVGAPMWVIRSLSVLALIGLLGALIFAWVYEMTPEGLKREEDVDRSESITPRTGRRLDSIIIAFLTITVVFLVAGQYYPWPEDETSSESAPATEASAPEATIEEPQPARPEPTGGTSIAVLPFVNMSAEAENEYFSDGISEELLNVLVRVSALEVASRTSSFAYKGKDIPISQIANELGVDHVLEGSVRKSGNRVRITAQLIDANTDRHLWSDTYDRELDDIFGIQDEISNAIVDALKVALDVGEAEAMQRLNRPTDNPAAYELYLQGRQQWRRRLESNIRDAIASFEQAVALDPAFAKAYEALAGARTTLPAWSSQTAAEARPEALAAANRALELDPSLAMAIAILAHYEQIDGNMVSAYEGFINARALEPRNATVTQWTAEFLGDAGYLERGLETALEAHRLDPAARVINMITAQRAAAVEKDELSIHHAQLAVDLGMEYRRAVFQAFEAHLRLGQIEIIKAGLVDAPPITPVVPACVMEILEPTGEATLESLLALDTQIQAQPSLFCATHFLGDTDAALDVVEPAIRADSTRARFIWVTGPMGEKIRQTPRFRQFLVDLGFVDLYEAHGWPDLCQPLEGGDFVCE